VATAQLSKRLTYVFDWAYNQGRHYDDGAFVGNGTYAWGLNNELIYQLNKKWAFGTRFGVLHDDGLFGGNPNTELYTVGVGANWTPNKWLTVKPEVRYDWTDKPAGNWFNYSRSTYQFSGGLSAVVKF